MRTIVTANSFCRSRFSLGRFLCYAPSTPSMTCCRNYFGYRSIHWWNIFLWTRVLTRRSNIRTYRPYRTICQFRQRNCIFVRTIVTANSLCCSCFGLRWFLCYIPSTPSVSCCRNCFSYSSVGRCVFLRTCVFASRCCICTLCPYCCIGQNR